MYPRMAMHNVCAALQARIVAGTPTPPVETPATPPAAETHEVQTVLHPVRISLNPGIPSTPPIQFLSFCYSSGTIGDDGR